MSDSGSIPDFQYNHPDGTKRTRFEMDQWLRQEVPKVHWLRLHASKTFGLAKNISWDMREIVLRHWLLDEMIRRNLIIGEQLGIHTTASNDETELRQFTQRLAASIQLGSAVQPQHAEGIDMTSFTPPPPPVGGTFQTQPTQTYPAGPPAPPPPPGPPGVPMGPPGYQPSIAPPSAPYQPSMGPPGTSTMYGPPGVPNAPPPAPSPAPSGPPAPPAASPGRRGRKAAEVASPPAPPVAAPVPSMPTPPGLQQLPGFTPVGGLVNHPLGGATGMPGVNAFGGTQTVAGLTDILAKLEQTLNTGHSTASRLTVFERKLELVSLMVTVLGRAMYQKAGTPDIESFLKELGISLPQ